MKTPHGRFIFLEGPDGVGKTTISRQVARVFMERGDKVELLSFPGATPGTIGKLVYDLHHDAERFGVNALTPASKQALHIAAHLDAIERTIKPLILAGTTVILDRFWWSTWVYGVVAGVEQRVLQGLIDAEAASWGSLSPDLAVLVRREAPLRDEGPTWPKIRDEYDRLARREAKHLKLVVVENTRAVEDAVQAIMAALDGRGRPAATATESGVQPPAAQLSMFSSIQPRSSSTRTVQRAPTHIAPLRPTVAYDTYWYFAAERQQIYFRRLADAAPPWSDDPIFTEFKFTNAYRAADRVSQYLIRRVIYRDDLPCTPAEVFFRIIVFKIFNKIETWELLERALKVVTFEDFKFERFDKVLTRAMEKGTKIYSGAYIMPSGGSLGHEKKHRNHLELIDRMMRDDLPARLGSAKSMQEGYELLMAYPTIGPFLAYQFITDVNYSELTNFSEMDFVVPGPGALDGIAKVFADRGGLNEPEIIRFMADNQEREFERLGLDFKTLFGRRLQLIDCQNIFCEVDKYSRVRHPEIEGLSGRTRIKQKFVASSDRLTAWFPPKWDLNVDAATGRAAASL